MTDVPPSEPLPEPSEAWLKYLFSEPERSDDGWAGITGFIQDQPDWMRPPGVSGPEVSVQGHSETIVPPPTSSTPNDPYGLFGNVLPGSLSIRVEHSEQPLVSYLPHSPPSGSTDDNKKSQRSDLTAVVNERVDELLSQALSEQSTKAAAESIKEGRRFRGALRKAHIWVHEHPPGWGAWVAGLLIPIVAPLGSLLGQSAPPPRPVQPPAVIQESGEPPNSNPRFPNQITGTEPDPEGLLIFVQSLSCQERAELVVGKLPVTEDVAQQLLGLTPHELFGLAVDGLSEEQVPTFKADLYGEIPTILPPEQQT
jgi:hypothetical protein